MSTLRQRNALRKLVNPGQSDDESDQTNRSGQSSQSGQSGSNIKKRRKKVARKNELLVFLHRKFFQSKQVYMKVDKKKAAEREKALLKVLQEFEEPEDNNSKDNKLYLRSSDTFPYPVSHKGKGKDDKLEFRSLSYPVSSEGSGNEWPSDIRPYTISSEKKDLRSYTIPPENDKLWFEEKSSVKLQPYTISSENDNLLPSEILPYTISSEEKRNDNFWPYSISPEIDKIWFSDILPYTIFSEGKDNDYKSTSSPSTSSTFPPFELP